MTVPGIDLSPRQRDDLPQSEQALVATILLRPHVMGDVILRVRPEDFLGARPRLIYEAMIDLWMQGLQPTAEAVRDRLAALGRLEKIGGQAELVSIQAKVGSLQPDLYIPLVLAEAMRRRVRSEALAVADMARDPTVPAAEVLGRAKEAFAGLELESDAPCEVERLGVFCHGDDDQYDWLITGLLERGDRTLIVAAESSGKSMLLRQFGITCSFGIHPFNGKPIPPFRVLLVDLENPPALGRRKMRPMLAKARQVRPDGDDTMMSVVFRPSGIDLTQRADALWLAKQITSVEPDLVLCGPLYKMFAPDDRYEGGARKVTMVLDDLRTRMNFALIMETHAPQEYGGKRDMRPIGSSLWRRWPEFGLSFVPLDRQPDVVKVTVWKPRDERWWPHYMRRGGDWPWTPCADPEGPKGQPEPDYGGGPDVVQPGLRPGFGEEDF